MIDREPHPEDPCAEDGCGHYRDGHNGGRGGRCASGAQLGTAAWRCTCAVFVEPERCVVCGRPLRSLETPSGFSPDAVEHAIRVGDPIEPDHEAERGPAHCLGYGIPSHSARSTSEHESLCPECLAALVGDATAGRPSRGAWQFGPRALAGGAP